jgi:hypothetical protein
MKKPEIKYIYKCRSVGGENRNAYAYCYNNPVNLTDPTGMSAVDDWVTTINDDGTKTHIPLNKTSQY